VSDDRRAPGARITRRLLLTGLVILAVVAALGLAEIVLRAMARRSVTARSHRYLTSDPVVHHRARAGVSAIVAGTPFVTNSLGLRDREYRGPKPPGTFRILMLGDSFTEGGGLLLEDTVAKRVERALDGRGCGAYEVINAGTASYSPILEYLRLQELAPVLEPDLIVLNFDMTDVHDDVVRTATAELDPRGLPRAVPSDPVREAALLLPPPPRWLGAAGRALQHLALYQTFRRSRAGQRALGPIKTTPEALESAGLIGDLAHDPIAIARDRESPDVVRGWTLTERYLLGVRDVARARGTALVLVLYPHPYQVSANESREGRRQLGAGPGLYTSARPFERLEALGRREGFPVVNVTPLFRARQGDGPLFRADDIHHTPKGAAVFAEGVVSGLLDVGVLPPCRR